MDILFQDEYLVAVHKPSGLLVHRSMIDRHETEFAMQQVRDMIGQRVYPLHRLDKPTSGVLLFALSSEVAGSMMTQFAEGQIHKRYLAVVRGHAPEQQLIDHPLKAEVDKMADRGVRDDKEAQEAVTECQRRASVELPFEVNRYPTSRYSLVSLTPQTGRRHQLRRHMKHIFHPIIGDTTHGDGRHNRFFRTHFNCHRLLLAATEMGFSHPRTGEKVRLRAPIDGVFADVVAQLGWEKLLIVGEV